VTPGIGLIRCEQNSVTGNCENIKFRIIETDVFQQQYPEYPENDSLN
jgi:hypothetical protein